MRGRGGEGSRIADSSTHSCLQMMRSKRTSSIVKGRSDALDVVVKGTGNYEAIAQAVHQVYLLTIGIISAIAIVVAIEGPAPIP